MTPGSPTLSPARGSENDEESTLNCASARAGTSTASSLGAQGQALQGRDVQQLLGIGGLQQQQAQRELDIGTANLAALQNAPFQQLSAGAGILQQLPGIGGGQQVVAPLAQTNPFAQAAGLIATGAGGLGALIG